VGIVIRDDKSSHNYWINWIIDYYAADDADDDDCVAAVDDVAVALDSRK
jgi:hypothetical protein